jgi:hypothetical protein
MVSFKIALKEFCAKNHLNSGALPPPSNNLASRISSLARMDLAHAGGGSSMRPYHANLDDSSYQQSNEPQTPILWAYEKGHDQIVALLKHYANKRPDSDVCSEYR